MRTTGSPRCRPLCIQGITSNTSIYEPETRSPLCSSRCFQTELGTVLPIRVSPILSDRESSETSVATGSKQNDHHYPPVEHTNLVSTSSIHANTGTHITFSIKPPATKPTGSNSSLDSQLITGARGLANLKQALSSEGISEKASNLILNARRDGTRINYESAWKKWCLWCDRIKVDPFKCSLRHVLDYLAELFHNKLAYRTIGVHRSAISAYHLPIDGMKVGSHQSG